MIAHPKPKTWIKYAKFEEKLVGFPSREFRTLHPGDQCDQGNIAGARDVYEQALKFLGDDANDEKLFIAFAKFEERAKEVLFPLVSLFLSLAIYIYLS